MPRIPSQPTAVTATAAQPATIAMIWVAVIAGNITDATSTIDSVTSAAMTAEVNALVFAELTQGPSTALSLHSMSRKTVAAGSSTPASTCTPSVISPSGEPGMSTIAAAAQISAAYRA